MNKLLFELNIECKYAIMLLLFYLFIIILFIMLNMSPNAKFIIMQ